MSRATTPKALPRLDMVKKPKVAMFRRASADLLKLGGLSAEDKRAAPFLAHVETVLSHHLAAQKVIASTTPANVAVVVERLRIALAPFMRAERGIDNDTFDLLNEKCVALDDLAARRLAELRAHRKIASQNAELLDMTCPQLRTIWEVLSPARDDRAARRRFVSGALDVIDVRHPDPEKHPAKLDAHIEADLM